MADTAFQAESWAVVEIMGHRVRCGRISEVEIAGTKFLRVDIPSDDGQYVTEFYGGGSIYAIRPASEEIVRRQRPEIRLPARPVEWRQPELTDAGEDDTLAASETHRAAAITMDDAGDDPSDFEDET